MKITSYGESYALFSKYKQLLKIMRLSFLLFILGTLCISASTTYSQETKLSLDLEDVTIKNLLRKIGEKTEFTFWYNDEVIEHHGKISLKVKDQTVDKILAQALKNQNLSYKIQDKTIFIYNAGPKDLNLNVTYQKKKIRGSVIDGNTGEAIPGVNVIVEGTTFGTITEEDGYYTIEVPDNNAVLVFTFVGYLQEKVAVKDKNIIDVRLMPDITDLEEVVVVGYGSQKRMSVVGSIDVLEPKKLQVGSTRSLSNNLAGQVAGLIAVTRSGEPGYDNSNFWIRGIASFSGSTAPLVLVDGIERDLNNIDPSEIESFSVLKDASASAMYGVRGANGVIIISTKRGKVGPPNVNLRVERSISEPTKLPKFIGGAEYMELLNELKENKEQLPYSQEQIDKTRYGYDKDLYPNVNWLDAITKDYAYSNRANLTVSGGSKFLRYSLVSSLYNEQGIIETANNLPYETGIKLDRYNMRANVDLDVTRTTTIRLNIGGYMQNRRGPTPSIDDLFGDAFTTSPIVYPTQYSDGTIPVATFRANPWARATHSGYKVDINTQLQSLMSIEQNLMMLTPGLKTKFTFSFDSYNYSGRRRGFTPTYHAIAKTRDVEGNLVHTVLSEGDDFLSHEVVNDDGRKYGQKNMYLEGAMMYFRTFGKSEIDALVLYNQQSFDNGSVQPYRKQGLAGRLSYVYSNRYITEFNFGYNGSENFEEGHRFGFFPSVALGWRISEEAFMEPIKATISKLKLRASYGKVGNDNIGGDRRFAYMTTVFTGQGKYHWGDNGQVERHGITEGHVGVSNLTWETSLKSNLGLEVGLWNNLDLQFDVFEEKRSNIFMQRSTIPTQAGYITTPYANYGKVTNKGFEGSLTYNARINSDWSAGFRSTFSYAINEITERDEPESRKGTYRGQTGRSMNTHWGLQAERLFTADDFDANGKLKFGIPSQSVGADIVRPGDIKYKDMDGDGQITEADEGYIGGTNDPRIIYGFGGNLVYRNWDLNVFFQGVGDTYRIIGNNSYFLPGSGQGLLGNIYSNYQDRWTVENPSQDVFWPRLSESPNRQNYRPSTWWKEDMSFLRLKTIELGYSLPKSVVDKIYFKGVRFYVTGNNLFCFSKFKLWDPELDSGTGLKYPTMRSVMFGIEVNFK